MIGDTMSSNTDMGAQECLKEICQDGWLKRIPQERRLSVMTPFARPAKVERAWVSFCIHNKVEPWLEFYENRRSNFSHNPPYRTSLLTCLHVSPSIRVHEEHEFVFAITLDGEIIKLGAQTRELMMEWIDALRSKLREMGILTPKDNLYSKEPEGLRSPIRNPNSPLPPTPIFQFPPPNTMELRDDIASLQNMRHESSPAPSMSMSIASGLSGMSSLTSMNTILAPSPGLPGNTGHNDPNPSPSVVSYVRHDYDPPINRRASFRQSLPSSPTSIQGGVVTFVRSPPASKLPNNGNTRDHVTVINVPSTTTSVFTFDNISAAIDQSSRPQDFSEIESVFSPDSSWATRTGNSLAAGGAVSKPPLPPTRTGYQPEPNYELVLIAESNNNSAHHTNLVRRRSEHRRSSRRENSRRSASVGPSLAPRQQQQFQVGSDGRLMSLREQQVIRLQREIGHHGGVRLTLRKRDCTGAIALVNCFGQIYVAGWKQRDFPYLHNTFHLGDKLISIGGVQVSSASEAQSMIRNEPTQMVEFIIKRVPHAKVFAIKKDVEGQPLGIIRDGNTATIHEVLQGGLAAQQGLPPRAIAMDGYSTTYWVLTEINHRPLNLFFKHTEIADRLNAVGRDISILVQPLDVVKQLKKQLKLIKGYKEYIVM